MRPKIQIVKKEFERRWFRWFLNFHWQGVRGPEGAARSLPTGINSRLEGLAELLPLAARQRRLREPAHVSNSQRLPAKGDIEHESESRRLNMREKLASKLKHRDREASLAALARWWANRRSR
jgi:hypothetical protein